MLLLSTIFFLGWFNWETLKTDDFTIIYKDEYFQEALHILQNLHYFKDRAEDLVGDSHGNLPVVIEDVGAISNGYANPVFNSIHIFTYPPGFAYRLEGIESWYRTVAVHEYAHMLHLRRAEGFPALLTNIFGSLFAPNIYSPGWITEGITVLAESRNTSHEGRLNDGFFDACIGARVYAGAMPSIVEVTSAPLDFPSGKYYMYGGEFFDFLEQKYGTEQFSEFFARYGSMFWAPLSGVLPFTGLDLAARQTFGKSWPRLFAEWQRHERLRFRDWQPAGIRLTDHGWYIYSIEEKDGMLYYVRSEPVKLDGFAYENLIHIVEFDCQNAGERIIASLNSAITTPLRIHDGKLYYTTPQFVSGYANVYYLGYGISANLHVRDLVTGEDLILLTDDIRSFCVLPDGRIMYSRDRRHDFGSEVWIYDGHESALLFETEMLVGELDASNGRTVAVARHDYENWSIYTLDHETCDLLPIVATPWIEGNIDLKGDTLLFTANYEQVYSIYMCDLVTGKFYRLTDGGYADGGTIVGATLYFLSISKDGFDVYATELAPSEYALIEGEPSPKPDVESMSLVTRKGGYIDVLKTMVPSFRMPFLFPTEEDLSEWSYGLLFLGGDATDENIYGGFVAQDLGEDGMIFNLLWQSRFLSPAEISLLYDHGTSLEYSIAYPAYLNLEYGVSRLVLFVDGRIFDGVKRLEFTPGFSVSMEYPYTKIAARLSFPYERQSWGSYINRNAQYLQTGMRRILAGGELRFLCNAYVDRHDPEIPSFSLRGYESIAAPRAAVMTAEYGRRLLRLRGGLWNPNVYFEDLFWNVFVDFAWTDDGTTFYSGGAELGLETKTGFGIIQVVPKLGIALTKSGDIGLYFGLYPKIPF